MNTTSKVRVFTAAALALGLPIAVARAQTGSPGSAHAPAQVPAGPGARKAEDVFKNIGPRGIDAVLMSADLFFQTRREQMVADFIDHHRIRQDRKADAHFHRAFDRLDIVKFHDIVDRDAVLFE